uniref:Uncharacterized protein n=1 Tax=Knipowitschia caucasica TaxID=637954 RepID=A0AAV2JDA5_KNICA
MLPAAPRPDSICCGSSLEVHPRITSLYTGHTAAHTRPWSQTCPRERPESSAHTPLKIRAGGDAWVWGGFADR